MTRSATLEIASAARDEETTTVTVGGDSPVVAQALVTAPADHGSPAVDIMVALDHRDSLAGQHQAKLEDLDSPGRPRQSLRRQVHAQPGCCH
jgi:hypothetical protein